MAHQVNGDSTPSSAFLSHLISYPLISDSISTFKSNPYGAKSLDLTTSTYTKLYELNKPLLPYLNKPYQYVSPYISAADSKLDTTLSTIDSKFPFSELKKPSGEVFEDGKKIVFFPLKKTNETKDYVFGVFGNEKKKVGQDGVVGYGKALVGTGLTVGTDTYQWISGFLAGKKAETKEIVQEKTSS